MWYFLEGVLAGAGGAAVLGLLLIYVINNDMVSRAGQAASDWFNSFK